MITKGKAFNKDRKADEENPRGSNVTLEPKHEGEQCNLLIQVYSNCWFSKKKKKKKNQIFKEFYIGYVRDVQ